MDNYELELEAIKAVKNLGVPEQTNRLASLLLSRACNELVMAVRTLAVQVNAMKSGSNPPDGLPDPLEFVEKAQKSIISASTALEP